MGRLRTVFSIAFCLTLCIFSTANARLAYNYYSRICPNVETIVRNAVAQKFNETFITVPATIRLFFHDCFVQGCDASVMIASTESNQAEKEHEDNLSLAGDGFDTVIRAKKAVDGDPRCTNRVSCADILAMATRDVIALAGGPEYRVELGRFDGLVSRVSAVDGKLPKPEFSLGQLRTMFAANGLTLKDMIALSGAHTVGFSHCSKFANRIFNFSSTQPIDPTLNRDYAIQLQQMCPIGVDERIAINMDPTTPQIFDNRYFQNLQQGKGLFTSDQVLFSDRISKPTVDLWARQSSLFFDGFVAAITKLGRVGVKTRRNGNIRQDCGVFNQGDKEIQLGN